MAQLIPSSLWKIIEVLMIFIIFEVNALSAMTLMDSQLDECVGSYFLDYTKYRGSIASVQKTDFEILMNLLVLRATESKKVSFGMLSVCVCVCVCVCV